MKTRNVLIALLVVIGLGTLGFLFVTRLRSAEPVTVVGGFPKQDWPTSVPEEQGMDSAKLAEGLLAIQKDKTNIHSLMIVRHGEVILDAYFDPYDGITYHDLASVTKSVMTTLIGIAVDQGKLKLDDPLLSFFPERTIANRDERKEHITIRHLVSNTSGLGCTATNEERVLAAMHASEDWVQFALDLPVVAEPGSRFAYCGVGMHLLSVILQETTGMTALEFARENLFTPLGIQNVYWPADRGYTHGWGDLCLHPHDMARLGYLFLHQGQWDGRQIVSKAWVSAATIQQTTVPAERSNDSYGYGWWVSKPGDEIAFYRADGNRGQYILVVPALDIVVVTTGGGFSMDQIDPYLAAAIGDNEKPLPANPTGIASLNAALAAIAQKPAPQLVPPLPQMAALVSGRTYVFETELGLRSIRLDFDPTSGQAEAVCTVVMAYEPAPRVAVVGLDGVYRPSRSGRPLLARGVWSSDDAFAVEFDEGPGLNAYTVQMRFDGDRVWFTFGSLEIEGKLEQ